MTIKIGKFQIVLFKITKLETYKVQIDRDAARRQADEIKSSAEFQALKARAQAARRMRG